MRIIFYEKITFIKLRGNRQIIAFLKKILLKFEMQKNDLIKSIRGQRRQYLEDLYLIWTESFNILKD